MRNQCKMQGLLVPDHIGRGRTHGKCYRHKAIAAGAASPRPGTEGPRMVGGMGGLAMGLRDAGFHIASCFDTDANACHAFQGNLPTATVLDRCIKRAASWRDAALQNCAVMAAGWPCRDFSVCGPGDSWYGPRGRLILDLMQSIRTSLPEVFVGERVG